MEVFHFCGCLSLVFLLLLSFSFLFSRAADSLSVNCDDKSSWVSGPDLSYGDVDDRVLCLQTYLNKRGYRVAPPGVSETTTFTIGTREALKLFQEYYADEDENGVFGRFTQFLILSDEEQLQPPSEFTGTSSLISSDDDGFTAEVKQYPNLGYYHITLEWDDVSAGNINLDSRRNLYIWDNDSLNAHLYRVEEYRDSSCSRVTSVKHVEGDIVLGWPKSLGFGTTLNNLNFSPKFPERVSEVFSYSFPPEIYPARRFYRVFAVNGDGVDITRSECIEAVLQDSSHNVIPTKLLNSRGLPLKYCGVGSVLSNSFVPTRGLAKELQEWTIDGPICSPSLTDDGHFVGYYTKPGSHRRHGRLSNAYKIGTFLNFSAKELPRSSATYVCGADGRWVFLSDRSTCDHHGFSKESSLLYCPTVDLFDLFWEVDDVTCLTDRPSSPDHLLKVSPVGAYKVLTTVAGNTNTTRGFNEEGNIAYLSQAEAKKRWCRKGIGSFCLWCWWFLGYTTQCGLCGCHRF